MIYYQLPVYKASYDLLLAIYIFSNKLPREYKYTISQDLKIEAKKLMVEIYKANAIYDKKKVIKKAKERLMLIRLDVRILKDLKQVGFKKFIFINEKIENISRQLSGWEESC